VLFRWLCYGSPRRVALGQEHVGQRPQPVLHAREVRQESVPIAAFVEVQHAAEQAVVAARQIPPGPGAEDDVGVEVRVLCEEAADHAQLQAVDGRAEGEHLVQVGPLLHQVQAVDEGGEMTLGLDGGHEAVVGLGLHVDREGAPDADLVQQPAAGVGVAAGTVGEDLLGQRRHRMAEHGVQAHDRPLMDVQHAHQRRCLDAGDVRQHRLRGQAAAQGVEHLEGYGDGHADQDQTRALEQRVGAGPVVPVEDAHGMARGLEEAREEPPHPAGAPDQHDRPGLWRGAPVPVLPLGPVRIPHDAAQHVLDQVRSDPPRGGLVPARAQHGLLTLRRIDGQAPRRLERRDAHHHVAAPGEQADQLVVDAVDLFPQAVEFASCILVVPHTGLLAVAVRDRGRIMSRTRTDHPSGGAISHLHMKTTPGTIRHPPRSASRCSTAG